MRDTFPILHSDSISALTTAWQISLICVHVDCTAINNQMNNIHSLPSGPCIQWGGAIASVCTPLATGLVLSFFGSLTRDNIISGLTVTNF